MPFLAGSAICVLAGIGLIDATFKKTQRGERGSVIQGGQMEEDFINPNSPSRIPFGT